MRRGRPPRTGTRRRDRPRTARSAWSTTRSRISSRSSRLPMSLVTRRSASARCSWWATSAADDAARMMLPSGRRRDADQLALGVGQRARARRPDERAGRPTARSSPGMAQRDLAAGAGSWPTGPVGAVRLDDRRGSPSAAPSDAERRGQLDEAARRRAGGRDRGEAGAVAAPGRDVDGAEGSLDRPNRRGDRGVRARRALRGSPSRSSADSSPRGSSIAWCSSSETTATARGGPAPAAGIARSGGSWPDASSAARKRWRSLMPVPAITTRVDPVVAQPAGVAPGANGVRVHAEHLGRARHAQRRVERSRMEQIHLRQSMPPGRFVKLRRGA